MSMMDIKWNNLKNILKNIFVLSTWRIVGNQWFLSIKSKAQWTSKIFPIQTYYSFKKNKWVKHQKTPHWYQPF
jgi:hypothetical protein